MLSILYNECCASFPLMVNPSWVWVKFQAVCKPIERPKFFVSINGMHQTIPFIERNMIDRMVALLLLKWAKPNNTDDIIKEISNAFFLDIFFDLNPS